MWLYRILIARTCAFERRESVIRHADVLICLQWYVLV